MPKIYTEEYTVQASDIDENNHMNNVKYVEWVQEISKHHWFKLVGSLGYDKKYFWVVINHNIDFKSAALLGDQLVIETYVEKFEGVFSFRRVIIRGKTNGKIHMKALTKWCMLSSETRRICRIPQEFDELLIQD